MCSLTLMQGPSGSGKSTCAREIACNNGAVIVSTDDFHYVDGEYVFQPDQIGWYHAWNQWHVEQLLREGKSIIVDNTNIKRAHAQPYVDLAKRYGAWLNVVRCEGEYPNVHGVPDEVVERMRAEMENLLTGVA